jgi:hypothetical protein
MSQNKGTAAALKVDPAIDPDIERMLADIEDDIKQRETPHYEAIKAKGKEDLVQAIMERVGRFQDQAKMAAEIFLSAIHQLFPHIRPKELRIGLDHASLVPVAALVVHKENTREVRQLMDIARKIELFLYSRQGFEGHIWTFVDDGIDTALLSTDFPLFRKVDR